MNTKTQYAIVVIDEVVELVVFDRSNHVGVIGIVYMTECQAHNFRNVLLITPNITRLRRYMVCFKEVSPRSIAHFSRSRTGRMSLIRGIPEQHTSSVIVFRLPESVADSDTLFEMVSMAFASSACDVITAIEDVFDWISIM